MTRTFPPPKSKKRLAAFPGAVRTQRTAKVLVFFVRAVSGRSRCRRSSAGNISLGASRLGFLPRKGQRRCLACPVCCERCLGDYLQGSQDHRESRFGSTLSHLSGLIRHWRKSGGAGLPSNRRWPTTERILSDTERMRLLEAALRQLPTKQRQCVQLAKLQGISYRDIAEILGISLSDCQSLFYINLARCCSQTLRAAN